MNLHNLRLPLRNFALWVSVSGRNGHGMGTHLWPTNEGQKTATTTGEMPRYAAREWWDPLYFRWTPFTGALRTLFDNGWVSPICGKRSQSRWPRAYFHNGRYGLCQDCEREARERGMMVLTYEEAKGMSPEYRALQQEFREWDTAGRPDNWPS